MFLHRHCPGETHGHQCSTSHESETESLNDGHLDQEGDRRGIRPFMRNV
jgi:hypothetical protein